MPRELHVLLLYLHVILKKLEFIRASFLAILIFGHQGINNRYAVLDLDTPHQHHDGTDDLWPSMEKVQFQLESTLPELKDLYDKGLFSKVRNSHRIVTHHPARDRPDHKAENPV